MKYIAIIITLLMFSVTNVNASEGIYVSGFIGVNIVTDSNLKDINPSDDNLHHGWELTFEPGITVSLSAGKLVTENWRMEGELSYRYNNFGEIGREFGGFGFGISSTSFIGNAWYDFPTYGGIHPYMGGGAGLSLLTLRMTHGKNDSNVVPVGQLGTGLGLNLTDTVMLTLDYRLLITPDPEFTDLGFSPDYIVHTFGTGIRVNF